MGIVTFNLAKDTMFMFVIGDYKDIKKVNYPINFMLYSYAVNSRLGHLSR